MTTPGARSLRIEGLYIEVDAHGLDPGAEAEAFLAVLNDNVFARFVYLKPVVGWTDERTASYYSADGEKEPRREHDDLCLTNCPVPESEVEGCRIGHACWCSATD